jgi:hypothetical protein
VETGAHAGPLCFRPLNQNAVNHTSAPGASVLANATSMFVRPVFPSNFHAAISVGGVAPTKLNTAAPLTPGGLPRLALDVESCSLIFTVQAETETTSSPGALLGTGIGDGDAFTFNPSDNFCPSVTLPSAAAGSSTKADT